MRMAGLILLVIVMNGSAMAREAVGNVDELVRAAIQKQKERPMWFRLRSVGLADIPFVYEYTARKIKFDGAGQIKDNQWWKEDVVMIDGAAFPTTLESSWDGGPIASKLRSQHEANNQKRFEELQRRSEAEKKKAQAAKAERQNERRQFWDEFLKGFKFELSERRNRDERVTTVVNVRPDPAYRPSGVIDTKYFKKVQGQLWIDDADQEIARFDIEFIEDVGAAFGFVGKVYKGTRYYMELAKQLEGVWLPTRAETELRQRILLFKEHETFSVSFGNYRRFGAEVKLAVPASDLKKE